MIDSVMLWSEPNNLSHWDSQIDPDFGCFAALAQLAADAIHAERPALTRVLGGISPIEVGFLANMRSRGVLDHLDAVAVHGFPLDWNHWPIDAFPERIAEVERAVDLPVWVTEVGASSFGAEEVQEFGLRRTVELLIGRVPRIHWYSLFDLPRTWENDVREREAAGSSYYRHFYMGLLTEEGRPKRALPQFHTYAPALGICQWFRFEDPRLDKAVGWLKELGVRKVRTALSWADSYRPNAEAWFDRQMRALEPFEVTLTLCATPEHLGRTPCRTSPPERVEAFAEFCARAVARYAS